MRAPSDSRGASASRPFGILACVGLVAAVGCGGPAAVDTNIAAGTLGEDFSAAEAEEFCRALENYAVSRLAGGLGCKSFGVTRAVSLYRGDAGASDDDLRNACESSRQECAAAGPTSLNCSTATAIAPCGASVESLESCLTDQIDGRADDLTELPDCGALTVASVRALAEAEGDCPALPSSCSEVATSCSKALGSFGRAVRGLTIEVGVCR